jgi:hypothetical protein
MDLADFAKALEDSTSVQDYADTVQEQVAARVEEALVRATPVDTGKARSNWLVSNGSPMEDEIEPYSPGSKLGISEDANAEAAIQQGKEAITQHPSGEDIFIRNNVDYIERLNDGWSKQAPALFVELGIQQALTSLDK